MKDEKNLEYYIEWMSTHKKRMLFLGLLLFMVPLLVVHILFKWESNIWWIEAEWDAGDIISYVAGFETFVGTTILSILALWQNNKHKRENDKKDKMFIEMENEKLRLCNMPQFLIQTSDYSKVFENNIKLTTSGYVALQPEKTHAFYVRDEDSYWAPADKVPIIENTKLTKFISLINCGNNTAHQVKLRMKVRDKVYGDEKVVSIKKDDEILLYLSIITETELNTDMVLQVQFYDCFQNFYEQNFLIKECPQGMVIKTLAEIKLVRTGVSMVLNSKEKDDNK